MHADVDPAGVVRVPTSSEAAYQRLRHDLAMGAYAAGQRLTEVQLSEQLGMSRTPIREALHRLQADGLVTPAGRGVVVASLPPAQLQQAYELRASLEALAAELAARRCAGGEVSPRGLQRLREAAAAVEASTDADDISGAAAANLRLHQMIAELSGNPFVADALGRISDKIAISGASNLADPAWRARVIDQHGEIVEAIAAGDAEAAARVAHAHIRDAAAVYTERAGDESAHPR
jgi:DNA-binding GntR family transcriptional regulator